jgi:hypothetical protein
MRLGMMAPEPSLSPMLPCNRVQFWQTENSWRLDRSYRGCRRRVIRRLVDAARFRSLIHEFPSPSVDALFPISCIPAFMALRSGASWLLPGGQRFTLDPGNVEAPSQLAINRRFTMYTAILS